MRHAASGGRDAGKVVAVIGDGAMTGGVAFEAVHQAGGLGTPIVVVLNDNGMSIAPNVGALSRYFNRVRLNPKLWQAREGVEEQADRAARRHRRRVRAPRPAAQGVDQGLLGARPVVGGARLGLHRRHRRPRRARAARARCARRSDAERPVVVHIATVKGKGFAPAEDGGLEGMEKWHAAKPKSIANGAPGAVGEGRARGSRAAAAVHDGLRRGDGRGGPPRPARRRHHRRDELRHRAEHPPEGEPEHYFDVGIAEQQAVLFAAGLALEGVKPVCAIYSTFLQRAYDQIVHDVCLQKLQRRLRDGPRRPRRRRRPDAPRRLRHRLPALPAEHRR